MKLAVMAAALLLGTTSAAQTKGETDYSQPFSLSAEQRTAGEALVAAAGKQMAADLKDPGSAKYRNVHLRTTIHRTTGEPVTGVCGQVNSKNSYGGYTGWEAFAFMMLGGEPNLYIGRGSIINAAQICERSRGFWDERDYAPELTAAALG